MWAVYCMHERGQPSGDPASEGYTHTTDDTVEPLLEPRDGLVLLDLVLETDSAVLVLLSGNSGTGSAHNNVAAELV